MNSLAEVYLWGTRIGYLQLKSDLPYAQFEYDKDFVSGIQGKGIELSPIKMPISNRIYEFPGLEESFHGVPGLIADSLPDKFGNAVINQWLASRGKTEADFNVIDRLCYTGSRGMGALEYHPAKETDFTMNTAGLNYDQIAEECEKVLSSKSSDQLDVLYQLGASSGGTRPKILLTESGREWIVKFPAGKDPAISGKREYDYSLCAKDCGITMTETALVNSSVCEGYFKTERFDRKAGEKIFSATFAGLLEADFRAPSCDYTTYMKLIRMLTRENTADTEQMYRVMCFNILTHNRDDHTKNFSFLYTKGGGWRLAPAYDLTYSDTYWGEQTTSVSGKGKDISEEDFIKVGANAGLSKALCRKIADEIKEKAETLSRYLGNKKHRKATKMAPADRIT